MFGTHLVPPAFDKFPDEINRDQIDQCFGRYFVWVLPGSIDALVLPIGPWTTFESLVSEYNLIKCVLEYLLETIVVLEIPHIFAHSDKLTYSKFYRITLKYGGLYKQTDELDK